MYKRQPVHRVLVVSDTRQAYEYIAGLLPPKEFAPISYASTVGEAKRLLLDADYDILVINTPLSDEFGVDFALDASERGSCILLLCKNDVYEQIAYKVEDSGVLTLPRPASRQMLYTALRLLCAVSAKYAKLEMKNKTLQEKMADIRVVNRAKWLLIEHLGMSEHDAHYYIEKQAMDTRLSRREVSEQIIRTYDT